jgi:hypothetical protein
MNTLRVTIGRRGRETQSAYEEGKEERARGAEEGGIRTLCRQRKGKGREAKRSEEKGSKRKGKEREGSCCLTFVLNL